MHTSDPAHRLADHPLDPDSPARASYDDVFGVDDPHTGPEDFDAPEVDQ